MAKDLVSAGDNQDQLDERRRPLASINPLYAQASVLPPSPSVDDSVSEQLSLNIAQYAANTLSDINESDFKNRNDFSFQNHHQKDDTITDEVLDDHITHDVIQPSKKKYSVILMSAGEAKLQVVKVVKETFGLDLTEAKDLVDSAPSPIIEHLSKDEAEELKQIIEVSGATVELMEE